MATNIHPTAIVAEGAEFDEDVSIGPYCVIGKDVKLGKGTEVKAHAFIDGRTQLGAGCTVFPFASVGSEPQDLKYAGEDTGVKIGDNNILREYVTINRGSVGGDGFTEVGTDNFFMAYSHVAHDCKVGSHVIMANAATLGGHVLVEDRVFIGGLAAIHQFSKVGAFAMIGGLSRITKDIPPYVIAVGSDDLKLFGLNSVGLKRGGMSDVAIRDLKAAYKILFKRGSMKEAIKKVLEELPYTDEIQHMIEFINSSKRGICR